MADNKFHGSLPSDMGVTLPNLQVLGGGLNSFTGSIPASLSNASGLTVVDFADCALSGSIPVSFGALHELVWFNFGNNSLQVDQEVGMGFITSLTNCTSLQVLGLDSNQFRGMLPNSVANLSSRLIMLNLGSNQLWDFSKWDRKLCQLNITELREKHVQWQHPCWHWQVE